MDMFCLFYKLSIKPELSNSGAGNGNGVVTIKK
jgi:hypothetical protein